jgi:alpha-D-xyloside xylohydrolase
MHYGYTMLYHQVHRETLDAAGGFLLTRTGRWGDQVKGNTIWPGDLDADLTHMGDQPPGESKKVVGGLPTALSFGIGLSASGFPFYASDTGGYRKSPPNNETRLRWVEANTVWSAMQVGDSSSEMPWEFNAANGRTTASLDAYKRYARLHMRLFPYAWTYAHAMRATGRPIVRPYGLANPFGEDVHVADEYFFGDNLIVAPVIEAGQTSRNVLLPGGSDWYDWFTGEHLNPNGQMVDAPLDKLPLYIRGGGIVPMLRDTIDTLAPTTQAGIESYANDPGMLVVRTAPGVDQPPFVMFDGTTIATSSDIQHIDFTPGTKFKQGVLFEIIALAKYLSPTMVTDATIGNLTHHNSYASLQAATEGWFYDPAATGGTLWIKMPGAASLDVR